MVCNIFSVESNAASVGASIGAGVGSKAGPVGAGIGAGFGAAGGYIAGALANPCPVRRALPDGGEPMDGRATDERVGDDPAERRDSAAASRPSHVEIPVTE